jgi:hypothetical protein
MSWGTRKEEIGTTKPTVPWVRLNNNTNSILIMSGRLKMTHFSYLQRL